MSQTYNVVAKNPHSTVVAEYTPNPTQTKKSEHYQSEAELERAFIRQLQSQCYEYLPISKEEDLISNLRARLEKLNRYTFSDTEWEQFFHDELANSNQGIQEKTASIQEDYIKILKRDDNSVKNIRLLHKDNIHDNSVQVINQYTAGGKQEGTRANRYDVTVLVNGFPLAHIELKRRGVAIQEAFNQINRYRREGFLDSSGLFEYVQLFVISNGTHTKYYSNTTRNNHIQDNHIQKGKNSKNSHSFEFTSWWADAANKPITDIMDFAKTFFAKHTLLNLLSRYCVFTEERKLLVMRPYQIVAAEKIIQRVETATNSKKLGSIDAGGYIWHTTGSGKTLTSFKTAQLASKLLYIKKVLFVVDRKDLDYQTIKEYDKLQKGAANNNVSTKVLKRQLEDTDVRIIITTIQKLVNFIKNNGNHAILGEHVALIFDECHRSQFGDMHAAIIKKFRKYHLFGFTGTPIFAANAAPGGKAVISTTEQVFGAKLHTYTIVNAIADKNVLPFKVDYVSTFREAEDIEDKQVRDVDRKNALASPERCANIVRYIREHFNQKTKRNSAYKPQDRKSAYFNSIFAVDSIESAKRYYKEFKKQFAGVPGDECLKVATIFSFCPNEATPEGDGGMPDENSDDTSGLDASSRDFLDQAIADYNAMFATSFDTTSEKFSNYYKDISLRVRNREIDILIVVNMFLTGFDATTLNTLWVDKNLRLHGLLQAYSRTNRIFNSVKTFGNIVCFRNLENATNESIALFGNKEARGIVLLRAYSEYYNGYRDGDKEIRGYKDLIEELQQKFPVHERIVSEQEQKKFITLYGSILRLRNILTAFDDFAGNEILSARDIQDYHSTYIDLYNEFRNTENEKENINDDLIFEMELIKQTEINIDYILKLIKKYHEDHTQNRELLTDIEKAIDASVELRSKKTLIGQFIQKLDTHSTIDDGWHVFVEQKKIEELDKIIESEDLNPQATYAFVQNAFRDGVVTTTGTAIAEILPPISRFSPGGERNQKREQVLCKITAFFQRFFDIAKSTFDYIK